MYPALKKTRYVYFTTEYIYISSMTGYTRHISTIMFRSHSELQVDITQ